LYGENFKYVLMNMRICCYDLVSVDSKTLVPYLLIIFTLFSLCFLFIRNQIFFGTRLWFNYFRYKIVFKNTILCGIDLALAKPFIANDSCTCKLIKFAQHLRLSPSMKQWCARAQFVALEQFLIVLNLNLKIEKTLEKDMKNQYVQ
jgi:hypothetical protein